MDNSFGSADRRRILFFIIVVFFAVSIFQLFRMQILEQVVYKEKSTENSIKKIMLKAPRGIFFDRKFNVLVSNKPSYSFQITPANYNRELNPLIENVLGVDSNYISQILFKSADYSRYIPRLIKRNVDFSFVAWLVENSSKLSGTSYAIEMQRDYSFGINGAHVFGYTREINYSQLKKYEGFYSLGDYIGIKGIEKTYENYLRGEKGYKLVIVNSSQRIIGKYENGKKDKAPVKGYDLILTLNSDAQKVAEKEFEHQTGSLVAIEPNTGEVLAFVSSPQYDLAEFASIMDESMIRKIIRDKNKPLFNRGTSSIYPPGSTIKMLAALIGLQEGLITEYSTIDCKGGLQYGNRFFRCHGVHGRTNVIKAIEQSCNTYFYKLILDIGLDRWANYVKEFGFGKKTGIDLSEESNGIVPDSKYYDKVYGKGKWTRGNLISLGIGQGELSVTTVQLAQYAALLANFGKTKSPHLVKGYLAQDNQEFIPLKFKDVSVDIKRKYFDIVREGMFKVVNGKGTATSIKLKEYKIAGKTGTSQNPHGKDHALFIAFAPYDNPKIAIAVMVENVGFGSSFAAPIARDVIKAYLNSEKKISNQKLLSELN